MSSLDIFLYVLKHVLQNGFSFTIFCDWRIEMSSLE